MNHKNYVLSQRLSYLALGAVIGYVLALNKRPLDIYLIGVFVLLAIGLSYWIGKK